MFKHQNEYQTSVPAPLTAGERLALLIKLIGFVEAQAMPSF
jgi:hypothetical protein